MPTHAEIRASQLAQSKAKAMRDEKKGYEQAKLIVVAYEAKHKKSRKAKKVAE